MPSSHLGQLRVWRDSGSPETRPQQGRRQTADAIIAVLAQRCAAGQDRFHDLIRWIARHQDRAEPNPIPPTPSAAPSEFLWLELAVRLHDEQHAGNSGSAWSSTATWLLERREAHRIEAAASDDTQREQLAHLLSCFQPSAGLHYEALLAWPKRGAEWPFPLNEHPAQGSHLGLNLAEAQATLISLFTTASQPIRLAALLLIDHMIAERVPQRPDGFCTLLRDASDDSHPAIRGMALRAASRMGFSSPMPGLLRRVAERMQDDVSAVRIEAARAAIQLQHITRGIVAGLTELFTDAVAHVRREAALAVAGLGRRMARTVILERLPALIADEHPNVVREAANAARIVAARMSRPILHALVHQTDAGDDAVRLEVVRAIGAAGRRASRRWVIRSVLRRFRDPIADVRREAIVAYGTIRRHMDAPPTTALIRLLRDANDDTRRAAVVLIGELNQRVMCDSIIQRLGDTLPGRPYDVGSAALIAVTRFGHRASVSFVIERVIGSLFLSRELGRHAVGCLTALGEDAVSTAVAALCDRLRSPERKVRDECITALVRIGEFLSWPDLLDELLAMLNAPEARVRAAAAYALEWFSPHVITPRIRARLEELRDDGDGDVRYHVGDALFKFG